MGDSLLFFKFKSRHPSDLDRAILRILKRSESSLSLNTLSFLLPASKVKISQRLKKLAKNRKIRKATKKETNFWKLRKEGKNE